MSIGLSVTWNKLSFASSIGRHDSWTEYKEREREKEWNKANRQLQSVTE